jgi:peptidoglycan/LPS O-acetylase OafA/YrhL
MEVAQIAEPAMKYRVDIDGLRAVAVLSVLAYHVNILHQRGGFVGVDVFFVISGYLISSIIFAEIAAKRFSVIGFYERRIRRIFPALFAVLILFSVVAIVYLLPGELVSFGKTMLAAIGSCSNIYFWTQSGYFESRNSNPLLHTWSLAVEEQFYILFPLMLVIVRRFFPSRLKLAVVLLFMTSLLGCIITVAYSQNTAFYMPYTRAWELLMGTILSLGMFPRLKTAWLRNSATLAGIAMIAYPCFFYTNHTQFPGLTALPPCIGAALIIGAGESGSSWIGSVLSWRPVAFVGLISYSLYLVHWPVVILHQIGLLSFSMSAGVQQHVARVISPDRLGQLIEVALSFALAVLSWRFVELPFRKGRLRLRGRALFAMAGLLVLLGCGISLTLVASGGFPGRFSSEALRYASYLDRKEDQDAPRVGNCFVESTQRFEDFNKEGCLREEPGRKNYLVLGDSHASVLWPALVDSLPDVHVMLVSASACPPTLNSKGTGLCRQLMNYVFESYLPTHMVDEVLLQARWEPMDAAAIGNTVIWARAHNIRLTVIGPVPEYDAPLPRLLAYSIEWNEPELVSQRRLTNIESIDAQFQAAASTRWHIKYISLYQTICDGEYCDPFADSALKIPLMSDSNHLNRPGAIYVVHRLIQTGMLQ